VDRAGHYVTITVHQNVAYTYPEVKFPEPGTSLAEAYQKVVETRSEAAAKAIFAAVTNVAKDDEAKQIELLGKAVSS